MTYAQYVAYKNSGLDVIGRLPAHWEVRSLRQIGRLLKGVGGSKEDIVAEGIPCVRYGDLYTTHSEFIEHARTFLSKERASAYTRIQYGDVLFAASGEKLDEIGKSAVNLLRGHVRCGGDLIVLRPTIPMVPRFFGYAGDAASAVAQKTTMGRGTTVKHIYPDELRNLVLAVPPIPEQQAIAEFLDRRTAAIDALIAKKERLLKLLAEKRQAVIAHAVTKGLDADVRLESTGVEWLQHIPQHWRVAALKHLVTFQRGHDLPSESRTPGEYPIVSSAGVIGTHVECAARGPGIVTGRYGSIGTFHVVDGDYWPLNTALYSTSLHGNVPRYVAGVLACLSQYFEMESKKSAVPGIDRNDMHVYRVPIPPVHEQQRIVDYLTPALRLLEDSVARVHALLAGLREYRQALITAAVTGKIDVTKAETPKQNKRAAEQMELELA